MTKKLYVSIGKPIQAMVFEQEKRPMGWLSLDYINQYLINPDDFLSQNFINKYSKDEIKLFKLLIKLNLKGGNL